MRRVLVIGTALFLASTALACTWFALVTISISSPTEGQLVVSESRTVAVNVTTASRYVRVPWVMVSVNGGEPVFATRPDHRPGPGPGPSPGPGPRPDPRSEGRWSADVQLVDGDNTIVATAFAWYWLRVRTQVHVVYQPKHDQTEPVSLAITSPTSGQSFTGERTTSVTGTVAGTTPSVVVAVNGGTPVAASVSGGTFTAAVQLADGENTIVATGTNAAGSVTASVIVTYQHPQDQTEPVAVAITSPASGQSFPDRRISVTGTVSGTAPSVVVAVNGGAPVTASVGNGTFTADVQLADGDNTIVATASNAAGSATSSVSVAYLPPPPPVISLISPLEGAVILGSRTVTVSGTLGGATAPTVTIAVNDEPAITAEVIGGIFRADVQLGDRLNALVATVTATEGSASTTALVSYPFLSLETFQPADRVIGRPNLTTAAPSPCDDPSAPVTSDNVCTPFGSAGWDGTTLFVSDWPRNRVLAFPGIPSEDGATAAFALGQSSLTTSAYSTGADGLAGPETVRVLDGKLFVAEYANNRILVYDPIPAGFAPATVAVGAASPGAAGLGTCTRDALLRPESFFVVGNRLLVADPGNNRVLIWNQIPTVSGAPADLVLGQPSFTTCDANSGGLSSRSLSWPTDVWSDGTRLFVTDYLNSRILGWSTFPTASNTPADIVLGQPGFDRADTATSRAGLQYPYFLASNGNQLFAADQWNNRVLVWNTLPATSGVLPDLVLGQSDFDHGAQNDDDQDGNTDASLTGRTLLWPSGVTVLDDALLVTDEGNSRYLVFRAK